MVWLFWNVAEVKL